MTIYDVQNYPFTEEDLMNLSGLEFEALVCKKLGATQGNRVHDRGIDGYLDGIGLQIKRSKKVGRQVVDMFETALKRAGYSQGWIIAFSFTKDAIEEAARVGYIKLKKIDEIW